MDKNNATVRFAVYGTLKRGHGNNRVLGDARYLGDFVTEPNYTMYRMGGFPGVVPEGNTPITCEVYETDNPEIVEHVYGLEHYSGVRNHPSNWYNTQEVQTPYGPAEMFIFDKAPNNRAVVENGIW